MKIISTQEELKSIRSNVANHTRTALVPTMGALHEGHLTLVKRAQELAELTWVSIFVNPLQFGPNEDFSKYPRTLKADISKLEALEVDYLWAPSVEEMYPSLPIQIQANPEISNCLCGLSRRGHFDGVVTVVKTLFEQIKPDFAIFGEKDYQQLLVIKSMVAEYKLPVEIIPAPIVREANGLALSSRNQYLSPEQKELASNIYQELCKIKTAKSSIDQSIIILEKLGIKVEYLEERWGRIFFAGRVGTTRLIDNL